MSFSISKVTTKKIQSKGSSKKKRSNRKVNTGIRIPSSKTISTDIVYALSKDFHEQAQRILAVSGVISIKQSDDIVFVLANHETLTVKYISHSSKRGEKDRRYILTDRNGDTLTDSSIREYRGKTYNL